MVTNLKVITITMLTSLLFKQFHHIYDYQGFLKQLEIKSCCKSKTAFCRRKDTPHSNAMPSKSSRKRKKIEEAPAVELKVALSNRISTNPRLVEKATVISQREVVQHSYEYTIPDINLLPQKIDQHFDSPPFSSDSHPDIQWCLRMYPKGCWDTSKFAVELRNVKLKEKLPVVVKCQFSFFNNGVEIQSEWAHFTNLYTSPDSFPLHIQVSLDKLKRTND